MIQIAKNIFKKVFPQSYLYIRTFNLLIKNKDSYLYTTGWMKSLQEQKPLDQEGKEIPWMNYPVISFLKERLKKDFKLFEYGSGYSTLFYAKLVQTVTSVEYDQNWFQLIQKNAPDNAEIIYQAQDIDGKYCRTIHTSGHKYDVVIIDGRDRVNCIKQSIQSLSDQGIILLDDSQREYYLEGINYAKEQGFLTLSFEGLKPTGEGIDRTTILYRRHNCFNI